MNPDPARAEIPEALSVFLIMAREASRLRLEAGFRHTPASAREALEAMTRHFVTQVPAIPLIRDELIPGPEFDVPVRLYHPAPGKSLPVALFVHGGGGVAGSVELYDPIARKLARATRRLVVSVDYRLAPECPHPCAVEDLIACVRGVLPLLDSLAPELRFEPRLALIGDSGGGALCAAVAHRGGLEPGLPIERLVLIYPSLDYTLSQPSVKENGQGYLLERERIEWLFDCVFQHGEDRRAASPLFMPIPPGFPATLVATAGYCPLRDEGIAYVRRLRKAGVPCRHLSYPGLVHAILNLEDLIPDACRDLYGHIGDHLSAAPGDLGGDLRWTDCANS
jgi:acetyl esterase